MNTHDVNRQALFTAPGLRVLVVDDMAMNLQIVAGLLKRTQMQVDVAGSGAECIDRFGREHYDILLLDYRMPEMNGIDTLVRLGELWPERLAKTPVICLTGDDASGDKEKKSGPASRIISPSRSMPMRWSGRYSDISLRIR